MTYSTSSGKGVYILQAADQRRNSTHKNTTRISRMIERHLCTQWFG